MIRKWSAWIKGSTMGKPTYSTKNLWEAHSRGGMEMQSFWFTRGQESGKAIQKEKESDAILGNLEGPEPRGGDRQNHGPKSGKQSPIYKIVEEILEWLLLWLQRESSRSEIVSWEFWKVASRCGKRQIPKLPKVQASTFSQSAALGDIYNTAS